MSNIEIIEKKYQEAVRGIKEEWLLSTNNNWYNYITSLPVLLQVTYMIVVFHNQVYNGGFHQYFVNKYGQFAKQTINFLIQIKATNKAGLLQRALLIVNNQTMPEIIFREKLLEMDLNDLFKSNKLDKKLGELDNMYYDSENEDIMQLLGNYLRDNLK